MSEKKKFFSKADYAVIAICLGVSALMFFFAISLMIVLIDDAVTVDSFNIDSFNMETETSRYTDSTSYTGTGTITCTDTKHNYYVLLQKTDTTNQETEQIVALVTNGTGEFTTYDYSETTEKPEYEFEILGFIPFYT